MATKKFITKNGVLSSNLQFVDEIGNATQSINLTMDSLGTLSFDGSNGQLFSVTDSMTGAIFSANDISGIPSIEVIDDGTVRLAEFTGNVLIGTAVDDGANKLQINGNASVTGNILVSGTVDGRDVALDGTNQDSHIADSTIHFTQASISITESQISDFGTYEPAFTKNTAFNKNFGTLAGTVSEGNHVHDASAITTGTIDDARLPATISSDITGNAATATLAVTATNAGNADTVDNLHETDFMRTNNNGSSTDLNVDMRAGLEAYSPTTLNAPTVGTGYGQLINIVSTGSVHNNTNNWITQLAFSTNNTDMQFRGKTNDGVWSAWHQVWTSISDGAGSGSDADLLDGQQGAFYQNASNINAGTIGDAYLPATISSDITGTAENANKLDNLDSTQFLRSDVDDSATGNLTFSGTNRMRYPYVNPNGEPSSNLGDPTIAEMALFQEQFNNKLEFYNRNDITFEETIDGTNWTPVVVSDATIGNFVGGDASANIPITNGAVKFRINIVNTTSYVFLNALYMYWSGNGHNTQVHIWKRLRLDQSWSQHTSSTKTVSAWPGHMYLPFNTIAFTTTNDAQYDAVRIEFIPNWNAGYPANDITLSKMQIWGGYPAGKRNIFATDRDKNVDFPANLDATTLSENGTALTSKYLGISANAVSASKWATARTITLSGDVTGSVSLDGSANVTMSNTVVANDSHTHSNYLVTTSAPVFGTDSITSRTANTSLSLAGNGTGSVYVNDSLTITGDLTVQGTVTTVNSTTVDVADKNITLGNVTTPTDLTADGGGITLKGTTDKTIIWTDATNTWDFNQGLNVTGNISLSGTVDGRDVAADGTAQDSHIADSTIHFTMASISITESQISDLGTYEPAFTKNTGFNKNFGTTIGTVAQGNDSRIDNGQTAFTWGNHASAGYLTAESQTATDITVSTTNFNNNLSALDNTVQKALDTLDDLIAGGGDIARQSWNFVATASQTAFTIVYDNINTVDVFINGTKAKYLDDYTLNAGTTLTLVEPADAGTLVDVYAWNNTSLYIAPTPVVADFTAGQGQTLFTANYNIQNVAVYANGIKMSPSLYTATNGTSITLDYGVDAGTWIQIISNADTPAGTLPWTSITDRPNIIKNTYEFVATASQQTFNGVDSNGNTLSYLPGNIYVIVDGFHISPSDYQATNTTDIIFVSGLNAGQEVTIISFAESAIGSALGDTTVNGNLTVTGSIVGAVSTIPLGTILPIASNITGAHTIPLSGVVDSSGFMYCDGSAIPASQSLSGSVPNLTDGRFLRGSTSAGGTGGADSFTLAVTNMPAHTHTGPSHTHTMDHNHAAGTTSSHGGHTHSISIHATSGTVVNLTPRGNGGTYLGLDYTGSGGSHSHTFDVANFTGSSGSGGTGNTGSSGSGTAMTHIPKYVDVQYIIKVI